MRLEQLEIRDFRCIGFADLRPGAGFNVVYGRNGSGKTSLLEAIYLLCLGRSFRSHRTGDVVRHGQRDLTVAGRLAHTKGQSIQVGVQKNGKDTRIRFNGQALFSASELARQLPIVLLTPDSHVELFSAPKARRRVVDMALFHVKQNYLDVWKRYLRCLKHRNQLLRQNVRQGDIRAWDQQLITAANWMDEGRLECVDRLEEILRDLLPAAIGENLELRFDAGWDRQVGLEQVLRDSLDGDLAMGYTRYGPHRADFCALHSGIRIERSFSRGQLKLVTAVLLLAQAHFVAEKSGITPLLLVDDLVSDLDADARELLVRLLAAVDTQVFMTMVESSRIAAIPGLGDTILFHVEHGEVKAAA
jgi:DNA replication and repair protein RecF